MAVTLTNSFEGVTPSGTTLTAGAGGNTGGASGSFFDVVNIGTGVTVASDSAQKVRGSLSYKYATGATSASGYVGWGTSLTATTIPVSYTRFYFYAGAAYPASGNFRIMAWFNSAGTICASLRLSNTGVLTMANSANAAITGMSSTTVIPLNAWCRIEGYCNSGTGACEQQLYVGANLEGSTADDLKNATAQSLLADASAQRFGGSGNAQINAGPWWYDDLGASDTAYLGSAAAPAGRLPQQERIRIPAGSGWPSRRASATYGR